MLYAYLQDNGNVATCSLLSSIPEGATYVTNPTPPNDRLFRNAWILGSSSIDTDLSKAKEITHDKRRYSRSLAFEPYDIIIAKQIPGADAVAAEDARSLLRDSDTVLQTAIDGAVDEQSLRDLIADNSL